ncbi:hypothetical protein H257_12164 [Aphanomyces astaci]|uniref:Sulfhydryl oxidase n=1 Tax=Aphanomyces astaci TaxID=112090 RepID=W4G0I5_APHAT|nr:hypothetical protein H257_12164 [Aphanomyces astaci]ETV72801.1 hypothetical protein H257_12164 [Aphanomyces astaci]RQM30728.1 hypothetical protein B5M09_008477 [Aphanomyces astaci]|eukprot:XP_009837587.1 hypothetical protein H257_12164 [Aphanomyces astaci]
MAADPNCADPVCHSKTDMFRTGVLGKKKVKKETNAAANTSAAPVECPLDREELGRATWGLLHTMAAYFPEKPSDAMKAHATSFVHALADLYPCKHCAVDFQESIVAIPPRVNSRVDFSLWMCEQHNRVTTKLAKKPFPCTMDALDKRWKTGDPSCSAKRQDEATSQESLGQDADDE